MNTKEILELQTKTVKYFVLRKDYIFKHELNNWFECIDEGTLLNILFGDDMKYSYLEELRYEKLLPEFKELFTNIEVDYDSARDYYHISVETKQTNK